MRTDLRSALGPMRHACRLLWSICCPLALFVVGVSPAMADDPAGPDYKQDIVPILRTYCLGCHNPEDANNDLSMHSFAALAKGGQGGAAFVPGKSQESLLYLLTAGLQEPKMPPEDSPAPSADQIEQIRRWIDAGAKPPADPNEAMSIEPSTPDIAPKSPPKPRVHSLAWSQDGSRIAIGRFERIDLVDPVSGYIDRSFTGPGGNITSVSFSSDAKRLLAAGGRPGIDGKAVLWDLIGGEVIREFAQHSDSLYAATLSPDQTVLATAGYDKKILLWNVASGEVLHELSGHNDAVFGLAYRPNGNVLASVSGDRTVKLWDVQKGERLDTFSQSLKELFDVAVTPQGDRLFAAGADNRIRVWNLSESTREGTNTLAESRFAHDGTILALAVSPDGSTLASAASNQTVMLWKLPELTEIHTLEAQPDWPSAIAFRPDGKQLVVGRLDGTIALFDVASGQKAKDLVPTEKPPPPPTLVRKLPVGVRRGSSTRVELAGTNLAKTNGFELNHPGLTAEIAADESTDDRLTARLAASADVPPGRYDLKVVTPGGTTAALAIYVDTFEQHLASSDSEVQVALPAGVWGTLAKPGQVDRVRFQAKKGQQIVFDARSKDLGFAANLVLDVLDATGHVFQSAVRTEGSEDPILVWTVPADGEFFARLHDLSYTGSDNHCYHLTIGELPFVTGVYPLFVPVGAETEVDLVGVNLPEASAQRVHPDKPGEVALPLDPVAMRWRKPPKAIAVEGVIAESEPNDSVANATMLSVPGEATGRLHSGGGSDLDHYQFTAKSGEEWIFETESARRGLPVDTRLDILTADGQPIERVWLAAVRDSFIEFRGFDSVQLEIRCKNWEEMELNEYMYMNGEVAKLFRHPRGPDSGFQFYSVRGRRATYFDTTATTHALEDPCYIVQPRPPGSELDSTGLPVFKVHYTNDDASDGRLGSDSRLTFRAPADGTYIVRVVDTRGASGPHHAYRLVARRPAPDFQVSLANRSPAVHRGSGREVVFTVDRIDGFDGEVEIQASPLPDGLSLSTPIKIEAGQERVEAVLTARPDASEPSDEQFKSVRWSATGKIGDATVTHEFPGFQRVTLPTDPKFLVRVEPADITIPPGGTVAARLVVERKDFKERITFEMPGLPHGVIVDNIGLNGILIPEGQSEREFFLTARPYVQETDRPFFARANEADGQCSAPVMLHVRRPSEVAKQTPATNPQ